MSGIRYPNITGTSEAAQLQQVRSYLHQLVDQLNMTIGEIETGAASATVSVAGIAGSPPPDRQAENTFNAIKALIIKSADIINAYSDEISRRLVGVYVAKSDFGEYVEETSQDIEANSKNISQLFTNVQTIISDIDGIRNQTIEANAYINSGLLYTDENGVPVYGLEIGQRNEIDGVETFNKFARFTAEKLSFYDQNDNEVAYISDRKLHITHAEITGTFRLGGFKDAVQSDGSVVTKWVSIGGEE